MFKELIIFSAQNNENAIFIINIQPSEVYIKKQQNFLQLRQKWGILQWLIDVLLSSWNFIQKMCGSDC